MACKTLDSVALQDSILDELLEFPLAYTKVVTSLCDALQTI